VLRRAGSFSLSDWYLTSGCLFEPWNVLDGREPAHP
jgi:hypothetical protein